MNTYRNTYIQVVMYSMCDLFFMKSVSMHGSTYYLHIEVEWQIYASANRISLGSGNGLSPIRHHAWMFTNADVLSTRPQGTYINDIIFEVIELKRFCKEMYLKIPSHRWCQFCLGLDVLISIPYIIRILILVKALMTTILCTKGNSGILEVISKGYLK